MLTAIVIFLFAGAVVFDFLPKLKNQPKRNKIIYLALIGVSFIVLVLYSFDVTVPGPSEPIKSLVESIFKVE